MHTLYADTVERADQISGISPGAARDRFPEINFPDQSTVLVDDSAGVVAAQRTIEALKTLCTKSGAEFFEQTRVLKFQIEADAIRVETTQGDFTTKYLVLSAGPWTSTLVPQAQPSICVIPRPIGYFVRPGYMNHYSPENFPTWINHRIKDGKPDLYYGACPLFEDRMKVGHGLLEVEGTEGSDPNGSQVLGPSAIEGLQEAVQASLQSTDWELSESSSCKYTIAPGSDFLIDFHPESNRVIIAGRGLGHAFKFGPLLGRTVANLLLDGHSGIPVFESMRPLFAL